MFFVSLDRRCFDEQLDGIFRHPHAPNWHVQVVELKSVAAMRKSLAWTRLDYNNQRRYRNQPHAGNSRTRRRDVG